MTDGVWAPGVQRLLDEARRDVDELIATGRISRADELASHTGVDFDPTSSPMYFTGDFEARLVLIHLNPKLGQRGAGPRYRDFDTYLDRHRRYGYHHWGQDPTYRSAFDHKQVRFLRPFGTIEFLEGTDSVSKRRNAELAVDRKLQLELLPYPSHNFPTHRFSAATLQPHFERVLDVVSAYPRDFVLFCGAVFDDLIEQAGLAISVSTHRFRLPTRRGQSQGEYRFSNAVLQSSSGPIRAGVARSFATQGLPMAAYGEKCHDLY